MFKKTKRRLVILNALVFFILQNAFGAIIYFYTHYSLYHQVDQTILEKRNHLQREREKLGKELSPEREENHRLVYLLWKKGNKLYQVIPQSTLSLKDTAHFSPLLKKKGLQTVAIGAESYRVITMAEPKNGEYSPVQHIQIVYNLRRENEMLDHLLVVIGFGSLLSVFIAALAGLYLANKALIPIKRSWEKQQRFVADASHELRTPLSVMKLNLEHLFRHPDYTIEQESETIHQAIQEIHYMSKMTSDLLTLARSDTDQIQLIQETIMLEEILQHVIKDFKALASQKNIQIIAEVFPIKMIGDKERLKQLFVILLDNALKYTGENGVITIKADVKNSRAVIEVADTGIGIPKSDLPYIFDRYYRGDKSRTRHLEGSGLGLSIANWIVRSHTGKIRIMSKEGEGTRVFVSFPLRNKPESFL
ncbi:HAMP domain-containing histidine kinase [Bacillus salipaludis]|uniref:histidine kinase n=1 Tax=Bacillus salipaludis TaxID=2547811 RepID=A0A4R5VP02_9BACI|nr:HAMP domain-containing sensor histidine kinase [Bacillus salipaludis]MDQ6595742.1 HAMP domain-containing sensor histidine kinase [Bacillus salipaludis]TDK59918.1 HAMP domain-containing histidine kinase [Bacillus salipaludis]